ncbi:hypothetical protein NDU88_000668 [Pleurodeles waltl]|uniref:Uncharacterized protein n=1 Tax=Pleurodeles waltl TaxID=8319 RepID=A0AAV7RAN9_PLEWA|nr:hypothetical protein NDU88_000668 [Pleurodeles waltl]
MLHARPDPLQPERACASARRHGQRLLLERWCLYQAQGAGPGLVSHIFNVIGGQPLCQPSRSVCTVRTAASASHKRAVASPSPLPSLGAVLLNRPCCAYWPLAAGRVTTSSCS